MQIFNNFLMFAVYDVAIIFNSRYMTNPKQIIKVQGIEIALISKQKEDYISITDMTKGFGGSAIIDNWFRKRLTIEFIGTWEKLYNKNFNYPEFGVIKNEAGTHLFTLSVKQWINRTNAVGIIAKSGRYGGTYAHKDIAFEFGSWLSPEFKLYLIKEFQRLKEAENQKKSLDWNLSRSLAKINYKIHTDAIKETLIPSLITSEQEQYVYANEADILNVALFGLTAQQWREQNKEKDGNIRDYGSVDQLIILSNMESLNSVLIKSGIDQITRLKKLNEIAIDQMKSLLGINVSKKIKKN